MAPQAVAVKTMKATASILERLTTIEASQAETRASLALIMTELGIPQPSSEILAMGERLESEGN